MNAIVRFVFSIQTLQAVDLTDASDEGTTGISYYYRSDDKYFVIYDIAVVKFTLSELVWREIPIGHDPTFLDTEVNFCNKKNKRLFCNTRACFFIMVCFETRALFEVLRRD